MEQEEFRDLALNNQAELDRIKSGAMASPLYNEVLAELYKPDGRYSYAGGWNWKAIAAVLIGVLPVVPGFLKAATTAGVAGVFSNPTFIESLYNYGLFFTFGVAAIAYLALSMIGGRAPEPAREPEAT